MSETSDLADRLFAAIPVCDEAAIRACYADDARLWTNVAGDGQEATVDAVLGTIRMLREEIGGFRYESAATTETATGFVRQHLVCGRSPAGVEFRFPACCVATVCDGRIARVDEYVDSAHLAEMGL